MHPNFLSYIVALLTIVRKINSLLRSVLVLTVYLGPDFIPVARMLRIQLVNFHLLYATAQLTLRYFIRSVILADSPIDL